MNCRPGDLAIVVKTHFRPKALGAIVRVLRPYDGDYPWGEPAWWIDWRSSELHAPDSFLRPLPPLSELCDERTRSELKEPA